MLISILTNGDTQAIDNDNVYQGSNDANTIYVVAPFGANIQMTMSFQNEATGEITEPYLMESPTAIQNDLNVWKLKVKRILTQYYGTVKYQIKCYNGEQIVATGRGRFQVVEGVDVVLPDAPTQEVYELILQNLSQLQSLFVNGWIEAQGLKPFNTQFSYGLGSFVIGNVADRYGIYKSLIAANQNNLLSDTSKWELISDLSEIVDIDQQLIELEERISTNETNIDANTNTLNEIYNKDTDTLQATNILKGSQTVATENYVDTQIANIKRIPAYVFDTLQQFKDWILGTYTRPDGVVVSDLVIGEQILLKEKEVPDYWYSSSETPITFENNFTELESKIDLTNYLQKTDVVDNLTSTNTDKPLSAKQGKVINENKTSVEDYNGNILKTAKFLGSDTINVDLADGEPNTLTFRVDDQVLANKQNKLIAGNNINIDEITNTISAVGGDGAIPILRGTPEHPINFATDMEIGHIYNVFGNVYSVVDETSQDIDSPYRYLFGEDLYKNYKYGYLIYKINEKQVLIINCNMSLKAIRHGQETETVNFIAASYYSRIRIEFNPEGKFKEVTTALMFKKINGSQYATSQNDIYAPKSRGYDGQLVGRPFGVGGAEPTWVDMTQDISISQDGNIPTAKAVKDHINTTLSNYLQKVNEQEKVYGTNSQAQQTTIQYNVEPYGDGLAQRTNDGRLKGTAPTENNDLVNKEYADTNLQNKLTAGHNISIDGTNTINANTMVAIDMPADIELLKENDSFICMQDMTLQTTPTTQAKKGDIYQVIVASPELELLNLGNVGGGGGGAPLYQHNIKIELINSAQSICILEKTFITKSNEPFYYNTFGEFIKNNIPEKTVNMIATKVATEYQPIADDCMIVSADVSYNSVISKLEFKTHKTRVFFKDNAIKLYDAFNIEQFSNVSVSDKVVEVA